MPGCSSVVFSKSSRLTVAVRICLISFGSSNFTVVNVILAGSLNLNSYFRFLQIFFKIIHLMSDIYTSFWDVIVARYYCKMLLRYLCFIL